MTGTAGSAVGKITTNAIDDKPVMEGVGTAAVCGLVSGGLGAASGSAM